MPEEYDYIAEAAAFHQRLLEVNPHTRQQEMEVPIMIVGGPGHGKPSGKTKTIMVTVPDTDSLAFQSYMRSAKSLWEKAQGAFGAQTELFDRLQEYAEHIEKIWIGRAQAKEDGRMSTVAERQQQLLEFQWDHEVLQTIWKKEVQLEYLSITKTELLDKISRGKIEDALNQQKFTYQQEQDELNRRQGQLQFDAIQALNQGQLAETRALREQNRMLSEAQLQLARENMELDFLREIAQDADLLVNFISSERGREFLEQGGLSDLLGTAVPGGLEEYFPGGRVGAREAVHIPARGRGIDTGGRGIATPVSEEAQATAIQEDVGAETEEHDYFQKALTSMSLQEKMALEARGLLDEERYIGAVGATVKAHTAAQLRGVRGDTPPARTLPGAAGRAKAVRAPSRQDWAKLKETGRVEALEREAALISRKALTEVRRTKTESTLGAGKPRMPRSL
jgi:hypothetical protein